MALAFYNVLGEEGDKVVRQETAGGAFVRSFREIWQHPSQIRLGVDVEQFAVPSTLYSTTERQPALG